MRFLRLGVDDVTANCGMNVSAEATRSAEGAEEATWLCRIRSSVKLDA